MMMLFSKNAKALVWKQPDKERYGGSGVRGNGRKTWCEEILLFLLMTVIFVVVDDNVYFKKFKVLVWKQQDKERCEGQRKEDLVRGDCFCRNRPAIHKPPVMQDLQHLLKDILIHYKRAQ